jgi:hypothetical protein
MTKWGNGDGGLLLRVGFLPEHEGEGSKKYGGDGARPQGDGDAACGDLHTKKKAEKLCNCDKRKNHYGDGGKRFHSINLSAASMMRCVFGRT